MKKIWNFLVALTLLIPMIAGCGGSGGSSSGGSSSYYYYFLAQQNQENNNNNNNIINPNNNNNNIINPNNNNNIINPNNNNNVPDTSDSSAPTLMTKNKITVSSGAYSESIFSIVGTNFGYTQGNGDVTLTVESGDSPDSVRYIVQKWNNDSINIKLIGLSTSYSAVYSTKIKTNSGAEIAGPNIEVLPNAIDNNIGNKVFAIFVGSPLTSIGSYCVKDATDVYDALVGNSAFTWSDAQLLTSESDATYDKVESSLNSIIQNMDEDSTFIFYYSGHGTTNYLAMSGGMTASEMDSFLKQMPEKAHKILFIDACSSGTFLPKNMKKSTKTFKSLSGDIKNLAVIAACGPENDSSVSTGKNQSEMTYALLEALGTSNSSVGISYSNTGLTLSELYNYMAEQNFYTSVSDEDGTQIIFPTFRKTGNDCYIKK